MLVSILSFNKDALDAKSARFQLRLRLSMTRVEKQLPSLQQKSLILF